MDRLHEVPAPDNVPPVPGPNPDPRPGDAPVPVPPGDGGRGHPPVELPGQPHPPEKLA